MSQLYSLTCTTPSAVQRYRSLGVLLVIVLGVFVRPLLATAAPDAGPPMVDLGGPHDGGSTSERVLHDGGATADAASLPALAGGTAAPAGPRASTMRTDDAVTPAHAASEHATTAPHAAAEHTDASRGLVIRTLLGLLVLLILAYLGGHPIVRLWERRLGVSQVITAGFPFVLLGLAAGSPRVGVLSEKVLEMMDPILRMSLGWIGLIIGFRFDVSVLASSHKVARLLTTRVAFSFLCIVVSTSVVLLNISGFTLLQALLDLDFLRDALILGSAGALMSLITPQLLSARGCDDESIRTVGKLVRLQELMGVIGLLFIAAYFRPQVGTVIWVLPGTAWLLLTLGLGTGVGIVMYAVLQRENAGVGEAMVMLLGSVAFSAGMAASLQLSPVVVCFVAGTLLANFPGNYKLRVRDTLRRLERPIYLLFLLVVGANWQLHERHGWLLMVVFVLARLLGNWLGTRVALRAAHVPLAVPAQRALSISPMGALSIAIVVNARLLYPSANSSALVTAIVGGAITTELIVQLLTRAGAPDLVEPAASEQSGVVS